MLSTSSPTLSKSESESTESLFEAVLTFLYRSLSIAFALDHPNKDNSYSGVCGVCTPSTIYSYITKSCLYVGEVANGESSIYPNSKNHVKFRPPTGQNGVVGATGAAGAAGARGRKFTHTFTVVNISILTSDLPQPRVGPQRSPKRRLTRPRRDPSELKSSRARTEKLFPFLFRIGFGL